MPAAAQPSAVMPDQMSAAGRSRLGSSVDWRANCNLPGGLGLRNRAGRLAPSAARAVRASAQSARSAGSRCAQGPAVLALRPARPRARTRAERPSPASRWRHCDWPSAPVSAVAHRSVSGAAGPAGSSAKPGAADSRARTAASVSKSSASVTTDADGSPSALVARHSGGSAIVSSLARSASAPASTGRQVAE